MFGHASDRPPQWADVLEARIRRLEKAMSQVIQIEELLMIDYSEVNAAITAESTEIDSVIAFVQGQTDTNNALAKQIADLQAQLAGNSDAAVQAALTGMATQIKANGAHLATVLPAIAANTPSAAAVPAPADAAPAAAPAPADASAPAPAADPATQAPADASATPLPPAPTPV